MNSGTIRGQERSYLAGPVKRRKVTFCPLPAFSSTGLLGRLLWTSLHTPTTKAISTARVWALAWPGSTYHAWLPPALSFPACWKTPSVGSCSQVGRSQLTNSHGDILLPKELKCRCPIGRRKNSLSSQGNLRVELEASKMNQEKMFYGMRVFQHQIFGFGCGSALSFTNMYSREICLTTLKSKF